MPADASAPLTEVPYAAASGDIRLVYDAIAESLGVRLVNLAYRHLAVEPGCLEWTWSVLGPPMRDGVFAGHGRRLVDPEEIPAPAMPLRLDGLGRADAARALRTVDAYNRANPVNAVALRTLGLALAGDCAAPPFRAPEVVGRELDEPLPIATLGDLPPETAALLRGLADRTVGEGAAVPTLFRHFAAWPDLLAAFSESLEAPGEDDRREELIARVTARAEERAREARAELPPPGDRGTRLEPALARRLAAVVGTFVPAICRMIVFGRILRRGLPG